MLRAALTYALSFFLLVAAGCGIFDPSPRAKPPGTPDAAPEPTTVLFTLPPEDPFYTRELVTLQIYVTGPEPERLELRENGDPLAVLEPPYTYQWDTTIEEEG